jgi:uncharacterized membrane protein
VAKNIAGVMRDRVARAARGTAHSVARGTAHSIGRDGKGRSSGNALAGAGGVAAGAGLAAIAPVVVKRAGKAAIHRLAGGGDGDAAQQAGETAPRRGTGGGAQKGAPGVGAGRRMPVQQSMDVGVPIQTCYNQWTQFEDWPTFMQRVTRVTQEDPVTVSFAAKIWGTTKTFTAQIETQRPDERIRWHVEDGIMHTGVVTFHELAPRLTRVELSVDVDPGSWLEKGARGMRHIKRAMRADMHRFKAFIEMQEVETGAWRGVIEDGELVEDHEERKDRVDEQPQASADERADKPRPAYPAAFNRGPTGRDDDNAPASSSAGGGRTVPAGGR